MSSEIFEELEEDFIASLESLTKKIDESLTKSSGQVRKDLLREINRELDDAQRVLEELELEAKKAPYDYRLQMNAHLKRYRQNLSHVKKRVSQSENNLATSKRNQLLGSSNPSSSLGYSSGNVAASNRGKLLQMNNTLERTGDTITRTLQIAQETDQVGIAVVDELGAQREALIRTKERLVDTDVNLSRSRRILRSMYRRVMTNKLILIVVIILEVAILCGVTYYKFFRK